MFRHHLGETCPSKPTKCEAWQLNISTYFLLKKLNAATCNLTKLTTKSSWCFQSALLVWYCMLSDISKWFEPRSISSSYCVIICVRVVLKRTVVAYNDQSLSTDQPYNIIDWQILFTWLWRWLLLRFSKQLQSPTTVLFRTNLAQRITQDQLWLFYFQNHQSNKDQS